MKVMEPFIEFLATVVIPQGFTVSDEDYEIYLTIDKQDVSEVGTTQNIRCGSFDDCTRSNNCVLLNGRLAYNVTMEYSLAAYPLEGEYLTGVTSFNGYGELYLDKILFCRRGRETIMPMPEYTIIPVQGEEFIAGINGQNIFRIRDNRDFTMLLEDPDIEKVVHIPYRLFVDMKCIV